MKRYRQAAILDLVTQETVCSQEDLCSRLRDRGFHATQATISRDVKDLQLVKRAGDGAYQRPGVPPGGSGAAATGVQKAVADYLRGLDQVQQLLVLRTDSGQAPPLAVAIDRAALPEVVGTLAGDDTILIITRHARAGREVSRMLEGWASRR